MKDQANQAPAEFLRQDGRAAGWAVTGGLTAYPAALAAMEARADAIAQGSAGELVWLLEHPALYTAGVSARAEELLAPGLLPVFQAGRGGRYTYHGPGQRVAYVMLDLRSRRRDVRCFVASLEAWIIAALAEFGLAGEARAGRIGVWVARAGTGGAAGPEEKIAAIGVKLRRWVSFHGVSVNVAPDLGHFAGIVPCGLAGHGVTSLQAMGLAAEMPAVDGALKRAFQEIFGPVADAPAPLAAR
jgi:lipoyl(octanoyl) transferase